MGKPTLAEYLAVPHCQRRLIFGSDVPEGHDRPQLFGHLRREPRTVNPDREYYSGATWRLAEYHNGGRPR